MSEGSTRYVPRRRLRESQDRTKLPLPYFGDALMFIQTNLLVDAGGHIHIAGLGAAFIPSSTPAAGVDRFFHGAVPELVDPQRFQLASTGITTASDMYAFGVLAWEVSVWNTSSSG